MAKSVPKILVVDDDLELRELLKRYLKEEGFSVDGVGDAQEMDRYLANHDIDLVVLDLMLPGEDGLSITKRIRSRYQIPIIMFSARGTEVDRVVGLEVGADDYLPKPVSPRELLARIRAVLRRGERCTVAPSSGSTIHFGPYCLETDAQRLTCDGECIDLTSGDYALLEIFVRHPYRVLSRDFLLDLLKGYERSPFDRSIDVRITRLRRKIEHDPQKPVYILTKWGQGYLFTPRGNGE